jgi:hypothetical protein
VKTITYHVQGRLARAEGPLPHVTPAYTSSLQHTRLAHQLDRCSSVPNTILYSSHIALQSLLRTFSPIASITTANMYATLTCYPPLGQTTTIAPGRDRVTFTVLIESSAGSSKDWEVALWHNFEHRDEWTSLPLNATSEPSVMVVKPDPANVRHQVFTVDLQGRPKHSTSLLYTITFRANQDEPWKWANEQFSTSDGHLIFQTDDALDDDLTHYIEHLPPSLTINKEKSDTPNTLLWSITSPVSAASGKTSGYLENKLGRPVDFARWFALVRLWSPWLAPRQGKGRFQPDKEAILASFEREDGSHLVIVAVSGVDDVLTTLGHDGEGGVVVHSQNDGTNDGVSRLIAAVGKTLEHGIAAAMYHARKLVMQYQATSGEVEAEFKALAEDFKPEWLENWCMCHNASRATVC